MSPEKAIAFLDAAADRAEQLGRGLTDLIWIIFKIPSPYSTLAVLAIGLSGGVFGLARGGVQALTPMNALALFVLVTRAAAAHQTVGGFAEGPSEVQNSPRHIRRHSVVMLAIYWLPLVVASTLEPPESPHQLETFAIAGAIAELAVVLLDSDSDEDRGEPLADKLARLRQNLRPTPAIATNTRT